MIRGFKVPFRRLGVILWHILALIVPICKNAYRTLVPCFTGFAVPFYGLRIIMPVSCCISFLVHLLRRKIGVAFCFFAGAVTFLADFLGRVMTSCAAIPKGIQDKTAMTRNLIIIFILYISSFKILI